MNFKRNFAPKFSIKEFKKLGADPDDISNVNVTDVHNHSTEIVNQITCEYSGKVEQGQWDSRTRLTELLSTATYVPPSLTRPYFALEIGRGILNIPSGTWVIEKDEGMRLLLWDAMNRPEQYTEPAPPPDPLDTGELSSLERALRRFTDPAYKALFSVFGLQIDDHGLKGPQPDPPVELLIRQLCREMLLHVGAFCPTPRKGIFQS